MACFLFFGALLGGWKSHPALPPEGKYRVTGVLSCDAVLRENGKAAAYLEQAIVQTDTEQTKVGKLYWTYIPDTEQPFLPREGDRVAFDATLYHPQGQENPYGFDFRMYLLQKGVPAGVSGAREAERISHPGRGLSSVLYHLKQALTERVRLIFGEDSALPEALLLGQRDQLPEETARHEAESQEQEARRLDRQKGIVQKIQVCCAQRVDQFPRCLVDARHQHHDDARSHKCKGALGKFVVQIPHQKDARQGKKQHRDVIK